MRTGVDDRDVEARGLVDEVVRDRRAARPAAEDHDALLVLVGRLQRGALEDLPVCARDVGPHPRRVRPRDDDLVDLVLRLRVAFTTTIRSINTFVATT